MDTKKKYILFVLVIVVGVALDQVTKVIATSIMKDEPTISYLGGLFSWMWVENKGAFLSLGADWPDWVRLWVLTIIPGLLLVGVLVFMVRSEKVGKMEAICFALISAGGLGNIIDRIIAGKVVDFMHMDFYIFETGVFNVADIYIMVGIGLYALTYFTQKKKSPEREITKGEDAPAS